MPAIFLFQMLPRGVLGKGRAAAELSTHVALFSIGVSAMVRSSTLELSLLGRDDSPISLFNLPDEAITYLREGLVSTHLRRLQVRDDAEDLAQEVLLAGLRAGPVRRPRAWLRAVSRYKEIAEARKRAVRARRIGMRVRMEDLSLSAASESELETAEVGQALRAEIAKLPTDLQTVLSYFMADQSQAEAAEAIGCSASTVRARLQKALQLLRRIARHYEIVSDSLWLALHCLRPTRGGHRGRPFFSSSRRSKRANLW